MFRPKARVPVKALRLIPLFVLTSLLSGCNWVVMSPSGDVAAQQRDLIVISTVLMLLIIIPVMALTVLFAWRYRESNKNALYDAEWHHSTSLEVVIWAAPLVIIIALGAITWVSTHLLDPYRPIERLDAARPVPADAKPLRVEVVALDWKWLFIYPDLGVATVNELAAPIDEQIQFKITSSTVMNSLFIPALAGQIYAMPGMETKLHAVINKPGEYEGFSANYSGAGFSGMRFTFHGLSREDFDKWVKSAKDGGGNLDRAAYQEIERPSEREPARRFATVAPDLYDAILNMCVDPNKMCMKDMMRTDARGGGGMASVNNVFELEYDKQTRRGEPAAAAATTRYVAAICTPEAPQAGGPIRPLAQADVPALTSVARRDAAPADRATISE
ncbi:MAG: ubiquinol oxidase subunit II [Hansschlegelia sp.]